MSAPACACREGAPCEYHLRRRRRGGGTDPLGYPATAEEQTQTRTTLIPGVGIAFSRPGWCSGPQVRVLTPEEAYGPLPNQRADEESTS